MGIVMSRRAKQKTDDGGTRARLLAVAGELFAAHGVHGVTAKEISEAAGTNAAAVNYYFAGVSGLYEAVLIEARDRAEINDRRLDIMQLPLGFEERLRAMIELGVAALLAPAEVSWIVQLFNREMIQPTPAGRRILGCIIEPRIEATRRFIGAYVGLPSDDPRVDLACINVTAPIHTLLVRDRALLLTLHPALPLSPDAGAMLVDHFYSFAVAGLDQLKASVAG